MELYPLERSTYQMIKERIEDNSQNWTASVDESKGDAHPWKAVNEVGCSVYPKGELLEHKRNIVLTNWIDAEGRCIC